MNTFRTLTTNLRVARRAVARGIARAFGRGEDSAAPFSAEGTLTTLARGRRVLIAGGIVLLAGWLLVKNPPIQTVPRSEVGVRTNQFTGTVTQWRDGSVLVLPVLHEMRLYSLRDQLYRPEQVSRANGSAPLQSLEGLSVGVDLAVRYALDPARIASVSRNLPDNVGSEIVEPAVQGVIYKVFARYTVREIFSTKRTEIQQAIEAELRPRLAADGIALKGVQVGKVDLPADYRRGMEGLLAEELATEKMRYTLDLKDKRVKETELDAAADKVRREVNAEAAGREQVIAAKAQEEAMKHVLPFKQRQIEQRLLEAEAEKQARVRSAEGSAQARRIEAGGEADARQKLAEAEVFRMERVGKANADQMSREGILITRHPLLIQKTLADKLSDKIQVIIAPPPADGGFIGTALLGASKRGAQPAEGAAEQRQAAVKEED
ncbi:MAG: prohibitin family protein [Burkholderiales bacterium]|nr:prohibitin family protein [Burkholderiales bacterium]